MRIIDNTKVKMRILIALLLVAILCDVNSMEWYKRLDTSDINNIFITHITIFFSVDFDQDCAMQCYHRSRCIFFMHQEQTCHLISSLYQAMNGIDLSNRTVFKKMDNGK